MTGIMQAFLAAGLGNPTSVPGGTITGTYNSADAYVQFKSDGTTVTTAGAGSNWYTPTTTSIGDSYWIRFTVQSGPATATHSGYGQLSSTRYASIDMGTKGSSDVLVEISSDSGGSTVVASGTYTLTIP